MRKLAITVFIYVVLCISLVGCYYDKELDKEGGGLPTNVSFSSDVQPVFTRNCALSGCHVSLAVHPLLEAGLSYDALTKGGYVDVIVPTAGILYQEISEGNMPPNKPISSREAGLILGWLSEGAKNN